MGLLIVLFGGVIGVLLAAVSLTLVVHARLTKNPMAPRTAEMIARAQKRMTLAVWLALGSIVPSLMFWKVVLSGADTRGEPLQLIGDDGWLLVPVVVEVIAIVVAATARVRSRGE